MSSMYVRNLIGATDVASSSPGYRPQAEHSNGGDLPFRDKVIAAGGAAVISAFVVNPLDVVKTRLQAQATAEGVAAARAASPHLAETWALSGCTSACQRIINPTAAVTCAHSCYVYDSTLDGLLKIVRQEGFSVLWRGTFMSLLMAIPSVGIYLPLYDYLLVKMPQLGLYAPLAAGVTARTVTVLATNPLELIRTRVQAAATPAPASLRMHSTRTSPNFAILMSAVRSVDSVSAMWRGLGPTLARDVPFSAIYWGTVEPIRRTILSTGPSSWHGPAEVLAANVLAGSVAGAVAAAVTTPLDVVKTQAQLASSRLRMDQVVSRIVERNGVRSLFTGVGARALRAAPACAIVLSSYELLKHWYSHGKHRTSDGVRL